MKELLLLTDENRHTGNIGKHVLADIKGAKDGPVLIVVAAIHGNENIGIDAVEKVIEVVEKHADFLAGRFIALKGNLPAIEKHERFIDEDMNRLWTTSMLDKIRRTSYAELKTTERVQVKELLGILDPVFENNPKNNIIFLDLHTFSGERGMFTITHRDVNHIELLSQLRIPMIFGIEHTLRGTCMEFVDHVGQIGFAFESGRHDTDEAKYNAIAGLVLLLVSAGMLSASEITNYIDYFEYLNNEVKSLPHKLDFLYKHVIEEGDDFEMKPGYRNFDSVKKGDWLATDRYGRVLAQEDGYLLMPLYQKKGNDGFFVVTECENVL